ncbi:unnamed protein product [Porites evermanni]|uniref:Reverse transcriptase/retrotransposon-derived protein RNase H-like domain-containing protein n=1 Tax=Porites evermanni TaxID=104178 RepID=A0ABN8R7V3_9CNID|nr:unnamed protein product [Porites evermanni]
MTLSQMVKTELAWWIENIDMASRPIMFGYPDITITTDASNLGWGAVYSTGPRNRRSNSPLWPTQPWFTVLLYLPTDNPPILPCFKTLLTVSQRNFQNNPPTPRYKTTWDPHIVLNYLSSLGTGDKLTLKLLSMKLLMLTALVSAERGQSLHMLDIRFIKEGETV